LLACLVYEICPQWEQLAKSAQKAIALLIASHNGKESRKNQS
jgi:hypothetical protein